MEGGTREWWLLDYVYVEVKTIIQEYDFEF